MNAYVMRIVGVVFLCIFLSTSIGWTQEKKDARYPTKPVTLIVSWAAGGGVDISARLLASYATKKFEVPVNVVNVTGASGITGTLQALNAKPDGYTMFMDGNGTSSCMFSTRTDLKMKIEDRTFISRATVDWVYFFANLDSGWKNLEDALKFLRSRPEEFRWGGGAYGSALMFCQVDLFQAAGIDMNTLKRSKMVVFEKGSAPSLQACITGDVQFAQGMASDVEPMLATKRIRVLAVNAPERTREFPDVSTAKELGYPEAKMVVWTGISGPKGLPDYVINRWDDLVRGAIRDPEAQEMAAKARKIWAYLPPAEFKSFALKEYQQDIPIAAAFGIRQGK